MKVHARPEAGKVHVSVTPGRTHDQGYIAFAAEMARGECLCGEIAASDRPCLTCEGRAVVAEQP